MADNHLDEDAFLALVTDPDNPIDAATAYAASMEDSAPEPAQGKGWSNRAAFNVGLLIGLVLFIVWLLW